ncbi:MAG: TIGR02217 family protein [Henriciella sp.]
MSGFHDVRFPMRLALGANGGPERRTDVLTLASGKEVRNAVWARGRRRWDVGGAIGDLASLHALISFFEARQGQLYGFRFRDPLDHSSALPNAPITAQDQVLGLGDDTETSFTLCKDYDGVIRKITKPVAGTVLVALDGIEQASGWSIDTDTGGILFDVAPPLGVEIKAGFEFDCAVRFDTDRLEGVIEAFGAGRVVSVGLIELF